MYNRRRYYCGTSVRRSISPNEYARLRMEYTNLACYCQNLIASINALRCQAVPAGYTDTKTTMNPVARQLRYYNKELMRAQRRMEVIARRLNGF
jgi:hypothetical protein